ncbi:MAG TPA: hypothetical protein VKU77_23825 [Streptosporangiaceae bacterium]|nr:hypothetical protein [Streptosporangiaceae bacterium]
MGTTQITLTCRFATAVAAGCLLLAGCGSAGSGSGPPTPTATSATPTLVAGPATPLVMGGQALVTGARTYLGAVPGTRALIAIVTQGTSARGYLCDGVPGRAVTLADWFTGPVRGGILDAVSSQHHVQLAARLSRQAVTGTIMLPGSRVLPFTAALAQSGGQAGLYEATGRLRGLAYHSGGVVMPDGSMRGATEFPTGPVKGRAIRFFPSSPI